MSVSVVVITRNRRHGTLSSLSHLAALPERPPVTLVDNGSGDGTADAVAERFPDVDVVRLGTNLGAAARNVGVERATTPLVAFSDDDSWWAPGALTRAVEWFQAVPRLGLLAGRILVGRDERLDPTCEAMRASPFRTDAARPCPGVMGFVACGAVVRRDAFLSVGGFEERFGVGGEEGLLALDLAAAGWELGYVDDVVAHHHPAPGNRSIHRRRALVRNDLWTAWLRRPVPSAVRQTAALLRRMAPRPQLWPAVSEALTGLPWVLRRRRVVPSHVEHRLRQLGH